MDNESFSAEDNIEATQPPRFYHSISSSNPKRTENFHENLRIAGKASRNDRKSQNGRSRRSLPVVACEGCWSKFRYEVTNENKSTPSSTRNESSLPAEFNFGSPVNLISADFYSTESWSNQCRRNKHQQWSMFCDNLKGMSVGITNWILTYPCVAFGVWALIYILFGAQQAFVGGSLFSLFVLEVTAIVLGEVAGIVRLPPALGMIAAGLILRNVPPIFVIGKNLTSSVSSPLRAMAVVVLLTRGALGVNPTAIRRLWRIVPHLSVISCVTEAVVAGLSVYFIIGFPIEWSALMGCIMSAMSGAIVMPFLLALEAEVPEERKETILIAKVACGLDAILAICLAEFSLGFIFGCGDIQSGFQKGVLEVAMGGAFGGFWGTMTGFLLEAHHVNELRTFAVFTGGIMSLLGLTKIGYPRGGPLGVFLGALIVAHLWRRKKVDGKNNCSRCMPGNCALSKEPDDLQKSFTTLWYFFEPLLFGIIGARTDFMTVDWSVISKGILCLTISLLAREMTASAMTSCVRMTWQDRVFIAITWIPKGTVQAALGPVALDTALDLGLGPDVTDLAYKIMNLAVLVIILACSLGSCLILFFGRPLIRK